ncbi:MAG: hypothetical protein P9M14_13960 [Candidatus Alcyoniella australis]|nr:hypothetical protein [Candidatus Alcyoniella australis]
MRSMLFRGNPGLTKSFFAILALSAIVMLSACAPFTYNRYQTAQTLGQGEMKLMVAANLGSDMASQLAPELIDEMEDKLDVWALEYPEYQYLADKINDSDFWDDFEDIGFDGAQPDVEVLFAAGLTDKIDLELRVSGTLYVRANAKIMLAKLGNRGAFSISPGLGWHWIKEREYKLDYDLCIDSYKGQGYTAELPLIFGWQFEHVAPYFAPIYAFHFIEMDYTRDANVVPTYKTEITEQFYAHQIGLAAGVQFHLGDILITPEVVGMYHTNEYFDMFSVYPGLALGATW